MKRIFIFLFLMGMVATLAQAQDNAPPQIEEVLADLSQRVGHQVTADDLEAWSWQQTAYADDRLGCPGDTAGSILSYRFLMTYQGYTYDYRISGDRQYMVMCATSSIPTPTFVTCDMPPHLEIGKRGWVIPGRGIDNNIRELPGQGNQLVGKIPPGGTFDILEGPYCLTSMQWWKVNYNGIEGWTVEGLNGEYWLEVLVPTPTPTPTLTPIPTLTPMPTATIPPTLTPIPVMESAILTTVNIADIVEQKNLEGDFVARLAWSGDGQKLVIAGGAGANGVWLYDLLTKELQFIESTEDAVTALAFQPGMNTLVFGTLNGTIVRVDITALANSQIIGRTGQRIDALAVSAKGQIAANGEDNTLRLWESPGEQQRVVIAANHDAGIWLDPLNALTFSPNEQLLIAGRAEGTLDILNRAIPTQLLDMPVTEEEHSAVLNLVFSPDGATLAAGIQNGQVALFSMADIENPTFLSMPEDEAVPIRAVAYSPNGQLLAFAGGNSLAPGLNNQIYIYDATGTTLLAKLDVHQAPVGDIAFSPNGTLLASVSDDGVVKVQGIAMP